MSNVKVTYFDGNGLGETLRMLLKYGNIKFEDVRIEMGDWPAFKSSTPFGQLPLYEEGGKVIDQSIAIARYLARKVKLAGNTEWENLEIDAIVDTINDFRLKLYVLYAEGLEEEKKAKITETLLTETIPFFLEKFEKIAAQNNGYLAVKRLTWADLYFVNIVGLYDGTLKTNILAKYKNLSKLIEKVEEVPAIKAWIKVRPAGVF